MVTYINEIPNVCPHSRGHPAHWMPSWYDTLLSLIGLNGRLFQVRNFIFHVRQSSEWCLHSIHCVGQPQLAGYTVGISLISLTIPEIGQYLKFSRSTILFSTSQKAAYEAGSVWRRQSIHWVGRPALDGYTIGISQIFHTIPKIRRHIALSRSAILFSRSKKQRTMSKERPLCWSTSTRWLYRWNFVDITYHSWYRTTSPIFQVRHLVFQVTECGLWSRQRYVPTGHPLGWATFTKSVYCWNFVEISCRF
jgi:hypothetical protein